MTNLLEEIREISEDAASELESIGFISDTDIKSLNRQDLLELLPGKHNLRLRKQIYEYICNLQPNNKVERENPPVRANEDANTANSGSSSANSENSNSGTFAFLSHLLPPSLQRQASSGSATTAQTKTNTNPTAKTQLATVRYKMVVSGKTLDKHRDIIEKLNGPVPRCNVFLKLHEATDESCQVILLFCPVVSRMGTDLDAAQRKISSEKPLIVVAMHHMHTPTSLPAPKTRFIHDLGVNVFFHETVNGLLNCPQNEAAITEMKTKLFEYSTKRISPN
ncbi:uncharacterized protein LOC110155057 isoform X1 [Boleophthalmus pectinirostris]|uniref:uncharacterized protein LOC110155057 isoform X1 n=1 Tax=Boleophthalmus pectinirostris TaxID=150288 RepID=UPI00242B2234|nr:uncharacterized protein LOC110155057 isoform X1 [Boleophthalmus pectinirostris]